MAELVVETTGKRARVQTAQTVLSSRPAMPSNLNRRREASLKEARIQTLTPQHNVNRSSRRPDRQERAYSHCKNRSGKPLSATLAAPSRQRSLPSMPRQIFCRLRLRLRDFATRDLHGKQRLDFNWFIQSRKPLDINQVQTPYRPTYSRNATQYHSRTIKTLQQLVPASHVPTP